MLYPIGVTGEFLSLTKHFGAVEKYTKQHFTQKVGEFEIGQGILAFLKFYPLILWPGKSPSAHHP